MDKDLEIKELLYRKNNLERKIDGMVYGSIEVRDDKYLYVHYREDGRSTNKYVGEYSTELYNTILKNNEEVKDVKKSLRKIDKRLNALGYVASSLSDKVKLNIDFAKRNLVDSIYSQAILEGVATTFADTEKIIEGGKISGMTGDDVMKVVNLKHAWEFILSENVILSDSNFYLVCEINKLVEEGFYYSAGKIRTTPVKIGGTNWVPKMPIESVIKEELEDIYGSHRSKLDKAIELLLYVMKSQMFLDGNKRTAVIFANHYLIRNGLGIIVIPEDRVTEYKELLIKYYMGENMGKIKDFLKSYCYQDI